MYKIRGELLSIYDIDENGKEHAYMFAPENDKSEGDKNKVSNSIIIGVNAQVCLFVAALLFPAVNANFHQILALSFFIVTIYVIRNLQKTKFEKFAEEGRFHSK